MPKTLKWATTLLSVVAVACIAVVLLSVFAAPADPAEIQLERDDDSGTAVVAGLITAIVQLVLCTLARAGRGSARVLLTLTAACLGVTLLLAGVSALVEYADQSVWAARVGGVVEWTGAGIASLVLSGLAAALTVAGLVLLFLPATNAYFAEVRRLRLGPLPGDPGPAGEA
ncbi:hypothetical protein [Amycolatopsis albispora]|uniref:Uncharacterized protein n=1 Tax=Amycolatopsis albispora TaxID=1804986 RepID=A0A344LAL0_9PSEU|nr:hypothetical protein [Amycolatopsis albispora]AXB45084.1 hypothetical protein A4R43_23435 [Amycolatopsis albispora]